MSTTRKRPAIFVSELHRASAQRGRLDALFRDLSDHWTRILQRLYAVWALIGPGLSDPGHIEIHSRSIYLDSEELLGPREQIAAGQLEARAVLRCFGVALHETFHAKHTKRWAVEHNLALAESSDPAQRQLAVDRRLLEEPRMEAHGVREFPAESVRGRFVRRALEAAVVVMLPRFAEQLGAPSLSPPDQTFARRTVASRAAHVTNGTPLNGARTLNGERRHRNVVRAHESRNAQRLTSQCSRGELTDVTAVEELPALDPAAFDR